MVIQREGTQQRQGRFVNIRLKGSLFVPFSIVINFLLPSDNGYTLSDSELDHRVENHHTCDIYLTDQQEDLRRSISQDAFARQCGGQKDSDWIQSGHIVLVWKSVLSTFVGPQDEIQARSRKFCPYQTPDSVTIGHLIDDFF